MTLLQALQEKKRLVAAISALWGKASQVSIVDQDGECEEEGSPQDVIQDALRATDQLESITILLNTANNYTKIFLEDKNLSLSIMEALAYRDSLKSKIKGYNSYIQSLRGRNSHSYNKEDKKQLANGVNIRELETHNDRYAQDLRNLDNKLQYINVTFLR